MGIASECFRAASDAIRVLQSLHLWVTKPAIWLKQAAFTSCQREDINLCKSTSLGMTVCQDLTVKYTLPLQAGYA